MKLVKCEIEFEVEDDITEQQVKAYVSDELAGIQLGDGLDQSARKSLEDTVFQGDEFYVSNVTFE